MSGGVAQNPIRLLTLVVEMGCSSTFRHCVEISGKALRSDHLISVTVAVFTLDAGPLARCQCPEGPATDHLDTGFLSWFLCVLKANAEVVPKYPRCHYMLLM